MQIEGEMSCNRCWHNCPTTEASEYCDKCATKNCDGSYAVSYSQFQSVDEGIKQIADELPDKFTRTYYAMPNEIRQVIGLKED